MIKSFFTGIFKFIGHYPGILYSVLLILVLPLLLYYNAYLTLEASQKNIDYGLQTKALMVENILSNLFSDFFDRPDILQQKVDKIASENPEIKDLTVLKEDKGGNFLVLASQNKEKVGAKVNSTPLVISYSRGEAIAEMSTVNGERFWNVVNPIFNEETDEKEGMVSISLSLYDSDVLISRAILRSYIIVFLTILLSLFLILQHTKLFNYVSLSKKLVDLDRMKNDFIRMTTHELRSPIVAVRGYIEILETELESKLNDKQGESLQRVKISAKNLNDLVDDILEVSRIEQGRLDFTPEIIDVGARIKGILEELKIKADQKNLELIPEIVEGNYFISANPNRFRQVIVNLVENAIKYTITGSVRIR
ncbi:MAG: HAMP domain-containing sensor histidine kinase, partial [Candidatus Nealsonbacteria bacterium]|nr:HAMP domain-containing sensor histidine kinase [Candidatus Nealsonbacteria bacterium]